MIKNNSRLFSRPSLAVAAILVASSAVSHATIVGFGNLGGSNTTVPANLASNATADGNGFVVSNGATPNIGVTWDPNWDIHTSNFFSQVENITVGGGDWDNEGNVPRVGQLDLGTHTIAFTVDAGFALVLNSFDFGHTGETAGTTSWTLSLTDSSLHEVWQTTVNFTNGQAQTIAPAFTGLNGEDYVLTFTRTASSYNSDGRHAIDNLNFTQTAVPEPSAACLMGLAGLALVARRRK